MMLKQRTAGLADCSTRKRLCCSPAIVRKHVSPLARPLCTTQAVKEAEQVTGTIFEPFDQVQTELATVSKTDGHNDSFARSSFAPECEAAINEQINIEYNASYVYHSLFAYFDRDNVGLPGFAKFFKEQSAEERGHAQMLMDYQNKRGGRVKFFNIVLPEVEYGQDAEKGDALYALELALSLEKLNFTKLRELDEVAQRNNDAAMSHFVQSEMLPEQVDSVKEMAEYVSRLRRVGKGLGVYEFDKELAATK